MAKDKKKGKQVEEQPALFDLNTFTLSNEEVEIQQSAFNYKIDDVTFWGVMVAAMGIPNRAVKIFMRDYDIKISRQAVCVRANKHPQRLENCRELILDSAEEVGLNLLLNGDKRTQVEVYKHITKTLGKRRYSEKIDVEHSGEVVQKTIKVEHVVTGIPFADDEKNIDDEK